MQRRIIGALGLAIILSIVLYAVGTPTAYAAEIFVTPGGGGNGTSWGSPTTLQIALSTAIPGADEIWVAKGIYTPGSVVSDTFKLPAGAAVYGGFAGTETLRSQRNPTANVTVLSGDIDNNDGKDANGVVTDPANIVGANSFHVVTADGMTTTVTGATVLDGFTITAGRANGGAFPNNAGGGFICKGSLGGSVCSPRLENLIFAGNTAVNGGAMYNDGANGGDSSPSLVNTTFTGNTATFNGGAMHNDGSVGGVSSPSLENVTFADNTATVNGGALYNDGSGAGGVSSPSLVNVTFARNEAAVAGGAIFNDGVEGASNPSLVNVAFDRNNAGQDGGAMYNDGRNFGNSSPSLVNVTFAGNTALFNGGAMYNDGAGVGGDSTPSLRNVILWGNGAGSSGAQLFNDETGAIIFVTSLVEGGFDGVGVINVGGSSVFNGGGNLSTNPLFVNASTGDLSLQFGSPAIDAGTNDVITVTTDLNGAPRKQDGDGNGSVTVDMGAYEAPAYYQLTVARDGNGSGQVSRSPVGIACAAPCSGIYPSGTAVTLTPAPGTGSALAGWSGACTGAGACVVTMDGPKSVTATFTQNSYALTVNQVGSGTVTKTPNQATYLHGTQVTLNAAPANGFTFTGWGGDCAFAGSGACVLVMNGDKTVSATFTQDTNANAAPAFTNTPGLTGTVGVLYSYAAVATDPNSGDTLIIDAPVKPAWLTLASTGNGTATLSGVPSRGNVGANAVQLRVQDQAGAFATLDFTITVAPAPANTGSVQGTVVNTNDTVIAGAQVTLTATSGVSIAATVPPQTTDVDGVYFFDGVPEGDYTLTVSQEGYEPSAPVAVTVQAGETTNVATVVLQPSGASLYLPGIVR